MHANEKNSILERAVRIVSIDDNNERWDTWQVSLKK